MKFTEMNVFRLIILGCFLQVAMAFGQTTPLPPLERKVSLQLQSTTLKVVLDEMEKIGNYTFAYRTDAIDENQRLSRSYQNQTTREVLDDIFQGKITYKVKGNYILLRKTTVPKPGEVHLQGYVVDAQTQTKIPYVTLYDTLTLSSAVSDQYGYYDLQVSSSEKVYINVKKQGYKDTLILWPMEGYAVLNVALEPENTIADTTTGSQLLDKVRAFKWFKLSDENKANISNFSNKLEGKSQFSIVPGVGTAGRLSSASSYDFSFNLLGGITGGVNKMEVASLFNLNVDSVRYFQAAGLFNAVGGNQRGLQMSGITNLNGANFNGGQFTGLVNYTKGSFTGGQFSGFSNIALGEVKGVQGAGFMNYANNNVKGAQLAGFMNIARGEVRGLQAAGFLNIATHVKGAQIGFINISDSISGPTIGFFSYSKHGYHNLELSANEITEANIALRSGSHSFYNTFRAGASFQRSEPVYTFGYGIGSSVGLSKRLRLFFDLEASTLQTEYYLNPNVLGKINMSFHWQMFKKVALAFGPSLNVHTISDYSSPTGQFLDNLMPWEGYSYTHDSYVKSNAWIGAHVALRFF
ncbi:STN and carboxypeptidase regulatory-like domain-containing protein [Lishizhenia sp.]|uniref:STN and carboxypeptidase regulatory-like domain-containing protein n=1 Tax=Lishizhenia sp. TaxID=2497594 RepID=UPI00299E8D7A|nr:STN and carboxypeptidase regulatory-like domain-containing protein [Lishizhenia sp.]MDX1444549.1 STN and carboxypeptidase regulatory-like domain-containing protein [Lishizhenia sp.]